jgi:hypothetical protein
MGCMKKLGCLFVLLIAVIVIAFLTRSRWLRVLPGNRDSATASASTWQPLTPTGAQRAKGALERLRGSTGPTYATVAPGDLAAYILQELSRTLPSSADSIEAAAIGDRLYVRAIVRTSDLGDKGSFGPIAMLLGERERLQLGGTLRIIRPGSAELQVKELKIGSFNVPQGLIPRLVREISRGTRPPELSPDGLPLRTPDYIGDVRVANGTITLYKTAAPGR